MWRHKLLDTYKKFTVTIWLILKTICFVWYYPLSCCSIIKFGGLIVIETVNFKKVPSLSRKHFRKTFFQIFFFLVTKFGISIRQVTVSECVCHALVISFYFFLLYSSKTKIKNWANVFKTTLSVTFWAPVSRCFWWVIFCFHLPLSKAFVSLWLKWQHILLYLSYTFSGEGKNTSFLHVCFLFSVCFMLFCDLGSVEMTQTRRQSNTISCAETIKQIQGIKRIDKFFCPCRLFELHQQMKTYSWCLARTTFSHQTNSKREKNKKKRVL